MKSGRYKHFMKKDSEEFIAVDIVVIDNAAVDNFVVDIVVVDNVVVDTVVVDNVVVDNFVVDTVVVIISLSKQLFWQPSKQQRPNGSCGSLVGQSTSLTPGRIFRDFTKNSKSNFNLFMTSKKRNH